MPSIRLTPKQILEKEFKSSVKGYNKDEVDQFLDIIIQDYELFQQKIAELEKENERLRKGMQPQQTAVGSTNYDILRRLSNLEKEVFGKKLYE